MLHIVTDSCAHGIDSDSLVTVVPNRVIVDGKVYLDGVDLRAEETLRLMAARPTSVKLAAPSTADFAAVYRQLGQMGKEIISIHPSRALFGSWHDARAAAAQFGGASKIELIDSKTISSGQGLLVNLARAVIERGYPLDEVVRRVRGATDRIYAVFQIESLDFLLNAALSSSPQLDLAEDAPFPAARTVMPPSHIILASILGVKPVLSIEHGRLMPIEKVRTRLQAVERLMEFAVEFEEPEAIIVMAHKPGEPLRMLVERLQNEFPNRPFSQTGFDPSLASLIGVEGTGLVILESELRNES